MMKRTDKLVRPNVLKLVPYSCARDEYEGSDGIFLDANESPYGPLNRYPDPRQCELREAIGRHKGIPAGNIFLGNGSDEIIDLCFRIFCNPGKDRAMIFTPTYGMYGVAASVNDIGIVRIPLDDTFNIDLQAAKPWLKEDTLKLVFICSPNNPTGNCMNPETVETIISEFNGIVVIDEAYADFSGKPSFAERVGEFDNLIVMQTFSKAMGLAAARVGMAFADADLLRYFFAMKPPYNISTINQEAALLRLSEADTVARHVQSIITEREQLALRLTALPMVEKVWPSDSNFLLVRIKDADYIYNTLAERKIVVRNRSREIPGCIRITTGTPEENEKLISELERISV
ncbi:MAG TPA: histidinol-phosphate transaminase [Bacteroidales bacterium]|jgi:histidinol-phosphate aminotransferase|nr:histidinol-phosphate transaminase [Bacteroidales bacterium]HRW27780.1 histidinol-phosphate transaminase [Bacteroidales bacterium]